VPPRQDVVATRYWPERETMEGVFVLDRGSQPGDALLVEADAAHWNPERQDWDLVAGIERRGEVVAPRATLGVPGLTPDKIWRAGRQERRVVAEYSYTDLLELRELQPGRRDYLIALHQHVTFPLANLVLLLLALPFAVSFERGSKVGRVVLAIVFCGLYLVIDLSCQNLGQKGWLHPVVAAWVPTILFGSLGLVIFSGIRT
jgi:lipopolysaccharide export LptBFGC system permease protein LptF